MEENYAKLIDYGKQLTTLKGVSGLLSWDESTLMPEMAAEQRGDQLALIGKYTHQLLTSDELGRVLEKIEQDREQLNAEKAANLDIVKHERKFYANVPESLLTKIQKHASLCQQSWIKAKQGKNFAAFCPDLEKMVELKSQLAEHIGYKNEPYDALLSEYEPGIVTADFIQTFAQLRAGLISLLERIKASEIKPDGELLTRPLEQQKIEDFSRQVVIDLGFDLNRGRIDASEHPFCQSNYQQTDVRITTRYVKERPLETLLALIHEAGHAMYEQGLPARYRGQPISWATSMALHESQSRWWENFVGRSEAFWTYYFPKFKIMFSPHFDAVKLDDFVRAVNKVESSMIRVSADEVTYNLHILFRTELERELIRGNITCSELAELWADKSEEYLGVRPTDVAEGVLQDIHWAIGIFGYFPTYALGNLYAAQVDKAINSEIPDLSSQIETGQFSSARDWHREKLQQMGSIKCAKDLVADLAGQSLSERPLLEYLERKYSRLYG